MQDDELQEPELLHPEKLGDIPYPKALSPSSIMEFKKCPQSFLFQYLYRLKQPTSLALAKGSMCHSALEKVFDLDPKDRTVDILCNLFRAEWSQNRLTDTYRILFETAPESEQNMAAGWDLDAEREWGKSGLKLLQNYFDLEDPGQVSRPNPVKREIWLNAHLPIDPTKGVTAANDAKDTTMSASSDGKTATFHVRGIVDRLDMIRMENSSSDKVAMRIVDYKTGTYVGFPELVIIRFILLYYSWYD